MLLDRTTSDYSHLREIRQVTHADAAVVARQFATARGCPDMEIAPVIVRGGGKPLARRVLEAYRRSIVADGAANLRLSNNLIGYFPGFESVHADPGPANDITAHVTMTGLVRVCLFPRFNTTSFRWLPEQTDELLERGVYQDAEMATAQTALLRDNDLLVFDHSKPHLFMSQLPGRTSDEIHLVEE